MSYKHTSEDGLVRSNEAKFIDAWNESGRRQATEQAQWVADLRDRGVKAAHPDDGWVNRKDNFVHLVYPQFNEQPDVGDMIALGGPRKYRLVRVIERRRQRGIILPDFWNYYFEPIAGD